MWILKTLVPFSFLVTLTHSFIQDLILYETLDDGDNHHVLFQSHVPKLSQAVSSNAVNNHFNFSNVDRVCARGVWFAYPNENYQGKYMPFGSSTRPSQVCVNSSFPYSSFRHLGASDTSQSALSLYEYGEDDINTEEEKLKWTGQEILVTEEGFRISLLKNPANKKIKILYFSITGPSPWLFFEEDDFRGKSHCFENYQFVNAWSVKDSLRLRTVGSVFKSCDLVALKEYKEKTYGNSSRNEKIEL